MNKNSQQPDGNETTTAKPDCAPRTGSANWHVVQKHVSNTCSTQDCYKIVHGEMPAVIEEWDAAGENVVATLAREASFATPQEAESYLSEHGYAKSGPIWQRSPNIPS